LVLSGEERERLEGDQKLIGLKKCRNWLFLSRVETDWFKEE
jgi:hypothetical protein